MKLEKIVHWSLLIVIILYVVTGLGITQFRTVEALTFGLLGKNLSFVIHEYSLYCLYCIYYLLAIY
jgi:cytochrome b subunit of formate dehydrogenase